VLATGAPAAARAWAQLGRLDPRSALLLRFQHHHR